MIWKLSVSEGMDVVDAYGPDSELWPDSHRVALDRLAATDESFADYIADVARIERMLQNWEDAEDGVEIDWPEDDGEDEGEDEDFGSSGPAGEPGDQPGAPAKVEEDEDEEAPAILEINDHDLEQHAQDMDTMFSNIIRKELDATATSQTWRTWTRDYDELAEIKTRPDERHFWWGFLPMGNSTRYRGRVSR